MSSIDPATVAIHNRLFFRLFQIGNTFQRQAARQLGFSTVQWAILGALARPRAAGGMTVNELAEHLVVSRQNLDGVLRRLERDGHVARLADAIDRRNRRVQMTDSGWRFWDVSQPAIYAFYAQAISGFPFDDRIALTHFLNKLQANLRMVELPGAAMGDDVSDG